MGVRVPSGSLGKTHPLPAAEETLSIKMSMRFSSETGKGPGSHTAEELGMQQ